MPVSVEWDNPEKTIVRFIYAGKWTWEDFYKYIDQANSMMDTVDKPVVSIIDMSESSYLPPGAAMHIRNVVRMSMSHNNSNISVYLQAGRFLSAFMDVLNKSYPDLMSNTAWLYTDTLEEARQIAREQVEKLHASLPVADAPTPSAGTSDTDTQETPVATNDEETHDAV